MEVDQYPLPRIEVKYFSLGGQGVGDFMVTISLFFLNGFMLVFTIIE